MKKAMSFAFLFTAAFLLGHGVTIGQDAGPKQKGEAPIGIRPSKEISVERDPFLLPPGVKPLNKVGSEPILPKPSTSPSFELKAILVGDRLRLASINRQIVTVGDLIEGERVLEIETDRVVLEKEGKKRILYLSQSPHRLIVEKNKGKGENR
jgi:hypothetical protein